MEDQSDAATCIAGGRRMAAVRLRKIASCVALRKVLIEWRVCTAISRRLRTRAAVSNPLNVLEDNSAACFLRISRYAWSCEVLRPSRVVKDGSVGEEKLPDESGQRDEGIV